MSKNVAMFVDVANMYYAARGQDVDVDYVALLKHATKGRDLIRAYAYTGLDPENENQRKFIDFLAKNGYKPVVKDIRKFGDGRMKANLDIELVVDLFRLADRMDIAVIVSGDGDFAPAIRALQDKGVRAEVISFKPNTSSDLIAVADEFQDIMKVASISRKEGRAVREGMSAPEMPAKEVTPEFGFREASPSVAAAALAALKGGGTETVRRGRGGSTRRVGAAASPAVQPEEERTVPVAVGPAPDGEAEAPRRRRRRGGRGRGRSRREDDVARPTTAPGEEEIGWEEFDDLSQLDGGAPDDREYTFQEADADTLAELGLSPDEAPAMTVAAPEGADEQPAKPRRRSTRAPKAAADAVGTAKPRRRASRAKPDEEEPTPTEEKPKPRRRASRAKVAEGAASSDAPTTRRRSPRAKAGDSETPNETLTDDEPGDEPQGIWSRFRSARKPRGTSTS